MEYSLNQRKLINALLILIIFVGVLLCSLFIYRTYQENDKKNRNPQVANNDYYSVTVEDLKAAVSNYNNYVYTPYDLLIYNDEINRDEFNLYSSVNFILGFLKNPTIDNIIKANLTIFNHNISSTDISGNGSFKIDNNLVSMNNTSNDNLSIVTSVYDTKVNGDKLIIDAYVLFQKLTDEEKNLHSYYKINAYHDASGNFLDASALVYEELRPEELLDISVNPEYANIIEWTFEKNEDDIYQFSKLNLIR